MNYHNKKRIKLNIKITSPIQYRAHYFQT
ncbi:IS3 family transposase [Flavobacterium procerum]|uniref:IS3 family transposase n=1 Tax=Flavobacterium procerum TaxID=1455569 RepID=A0ABV6BRK8_9FLAO